MAGDDARVTGMQPTGAQSIERLEGARERSSSRSPHRVRADLPAPVAAAMSRLSFDEAMTDALNPRPEAVSILCCRMCSGAPAFEARDSRGLLQHMVRMHLGQQLPVETIEQLRNLNKGMCQVCGGIRACTVPYCSHCCMATPLRDPQIGDTVPDRRRGVQTEDSQAQSQNPSGAEPGEAESPQGGDEDDSGSQSVAPVLRSVSCPRGFEEAARELCQPPPMMPLVGLGQVRRLLERVYRRRHAR